jgi:hypothetical protein
MINGLKLILSRAAVLLSAVALFAGVGTAIIAAPAHAEEKTVTLSCGEEPPQRLSNSGNGMDWKPRAG